MITAIFFTSAATASLVQACDLASVTTARAVHDALARRAVEVIALAESSENSDNRKRLDRLVAPVAEFNLGGGDVGRALGTGIAGASALAELMKADEFRYLGWDYMDGPSNGCGEKSVTVEFIDTHSHYLSQVEFKFSQGRVVEAKGWQRSFMQGTVQSAHHPQP